MEKTERIKRGALRVASAAFNAGDWAAYLDPSRAEVIVEMANSVITSLADAGCFGDAYGDNGSFEIDMAAGYVAKQAARRMPFGAESLSAYKTEIFARVRELDAAGILSPADRKRSRTFAADREEAEAAQRKAAEAERERRQKEEQERKERAKRREAARRRLAEIEAEKIVNDKEVR